MSNSERMHSPSVWKTKWCSSCFSFCVCPSLSRSIDCTSTSSWTVCRTQDTRERGKDRGKEREKETDQVQMHDWFRQMRGVDVEKTQHGERFGFRVAATVSLPFANTAALAACALSFLCSCWLPPLFRYQCARFLSHLHVSLRLSVQFGSSGHRSRIKLWRYPFVSSCSCFSTYESFFLDGLKWSLRLVIALSCLTSFCLALIIVHFICWSLSFIIRSSLVRFLVCTISSVTIDSTHSWSWMGRDLWFDHRTSFLANIVHHGLLLSLSVCLSCLSLSFLSCLSPYWIHQWSNSLYLCRFLCLPDLPSSLSLSVCLPSLRVGFWSWLRFPWHILGSRRNWRLQHRTRCGMTRGPHERGAISTSLFPISSFFLAFFLAPPHFCSVLAPFPQTVSRTVPLLGVDKGSVTIALRRAAISDPAILPPLKVRNRKKTRRNCKKEPDALFVLSKKRNKRAERTRRALSRSHSEESPCLKVRILLLRSGMERELGPAPMVISWMIMV